MASFTGTAAHYNPSEIHSPNPSSTPCREGSRAPSFQLNGSFVRPMLLHQGDAEDETTDIHVEDDEGVRELLRTWLKQWLKQWGIGD